MRKIIFLVMICLLFSNFSFAQAEKFKEIEKNVFIYSVNIYSNLTKLDTIINLQGNLLSNSDYLYILDNLQLINNELNKIQNNNLDYKIEDLYKTIFANGDAQELNNESPRQLIRDDIRLIIQSQVGIVVGLMRIPPDLTRFFINRTRSGVSNSKTRREARRERRIVRQDRNKSRRNSNLNRIGEFNKNLPNMLNSLNNVTNISKNVVNNILDILQEILGRFGIGGSQLSNSNSGQKQMIEPRQQPISRQQPNQKPQPSQVQSFFVKETFYFK